MLGGLGFAASVAHHRAFSIYKPADSSLDQCEMPDGSKNGAELETIGRRIAARDKDLPRRAA